MISQVLYLGLNSLFLCPLCIAILKFCFFNSYRQLESLIRLAEAHARLRFSHQVQVVDVEEASRLHKEALKQSAVDPSTGTIDVSILTTGQSEGMKKRRVAIKNNLKDLVKRKGKVQTINYQKTWNELKEASDVVSEKYLYRIFRKKIT